MRDKSGSISEVVGFTADLCRGSDVQFSNAAHP